MNTAKPLVLVIEDDAKISQLLIDYLTQADFQTQAIFDGQVALNVLAHSTPSAIILDLMLPSVDGIEICKQVRKVSDVPILMLTARIDEIDRLLGLDVGADDYVCKPFSPKEVLARVRALIRRSQGMVITPSRWKIDEESMRITWHGQLLSLTAVEFKILNLLIKRAGRVFSRSQLLDCVYDDLHDINDRTIDSHIKNIRRKIQTIDPTNDSISSIYGVGYRFEV
jgi:two-component system, OmpR family, response regulator BaeR